MPAMTSLQRDLIRQALGLNINRKSSRKSYVCAGTFEHKPALAAMVRSGWMTRRQLDPVYCGVGKMYVYTVTPAGALLALNTGEELDQDVFPGISLQHKMEI